MPVSSYSHDSEEMRKKITTIAIAGDTIILLDNIEGRFGNDALDRATTTTRWEGQNFWVATTSGSASAGHLVRDRNNVIVAPDTARRIIHMRLDVMDEHPETRTGFHHPI